MLRRGELTPAGESDSSGMKFVTRSSLRRHAERTAIRQDEESLPLRTVASVTGMSEHEVTLLLKGKQLTGKSVRRRLHITLASLREWAAQNRPDLLRAIEEAAN
jgi:hypothetical protein